MNGFIFTILLFAATALMIIVPSGAQDQPKGEARLDALEQRVSMLEKRLAIFEEMALTPTALHEYIRTHARDLAGDKEQDLTDALASAEGKGLTENQQRDAYGKAIRIMEAYHKSIGKTCPQHCKDEYDSCKGTPTQCFGRYVACCLAR